MTKLANKLLDCERIIIIGHVSPDGDALGSALAIRRALLSLGKQAAAVFQDPVPRMYDFLPDARTVLTPENLAFEPDCALFVDVAAGDRAGTALDITERLPCRLLLDHHATNVGFQGLAVIDKDASSTGELALELIDALGASLDRETALLLYVAIATDTGNFSFSNTTPACMRAVARCLEAGLAIDEVSRRLFRLRSVPRTQLIGDALSSMARLDDGRIAYACLSREQIDYRHARDEDTEGLVNFLTDMEGVEACFLAKENGEGIKISLRSNGQIDVAQVAQSMGGGGHARAAGVTLSMPLESAALKVLDALRRGLGERT